MQAAPAVPPRTLLHTAVAPGARARVQVLKHGRWQRVTAGQPIIRGSEAHLRFFILVEGLASLRLLHKGQSEEPRLQRSGSCFDLSECGLRGARVYACARVRPFAPARSPESPTARGACARRCGQAGLCLPACWMCLSGPPAAV